MGRGKGPEARAASTAAHFHDYSEFQPATVTRSRLALAPRVAAIPGCHSGPSGLEKDKSQNQARRPPARCHAAIRLCGVRATRVSWLLDGDLGFVHPISYTFVFVVYSKCENICTRVQMMGSV